MSYFNLPALAQEARQNMNRYELLHDRDGLFNVQEAIRKIRAELKRRERQALSTYELISK